MTMVTAVDSMASCGDGNPASHQLMIASCDTMEGQCLRVLGLHGDGGLQKIRQKVLIVKLFVPHAQTITDT